MKAYVFPGQGAQFSGMGKDLFESHNNSKRLFELSNNVLGFNISEIMFHGSELDLKQTKVTQPAIFLHSVILAKSLGTNFNPDVVAGHSLGEISALVANKCLEFEDGLELVHKRALAMQKACEETPSTMAAIIGLDDSIVEKICEEIPGIVVPANYNCPGQLVISGEINAIDLAIEKLSENGARRAIKLPVGGAFHSPVMESAKDELKKAINSTSFSKPICPIYQNVSAESVENPDHIKENLIEQLTSPVKWTQIMKNMVKNKNLEVIEVGPGKVLQGLFKKIDRSIPTCSAGVL
jgi:[acyl-carrier-protein] S-malonyltransferase|tara:strand:+ start:552 stop:1436 length:885 start_codon:yes stop_codon:yes gene_type:complete